MIDQLGAERDAAIAERDQARRALELAVPPGSVVPGLNRAGGLVVDYQPEPRWLRVGYRVYPIVLAGQMLVERGRTVGGAAEVMATMPNSMAFGDPVPMHEVEEYAELADALRAAERYVANTGPQAAGGGA